MEMVAIIRLTTFIYFNVKLNALWLGGLCPVAWGV